MLTKPEGSALNSNPPEFVQYQTIQYQTIAITIVVVADQTKARSPVGERAGQGIPAIEVYRSEGLQR